MWMPTLLALVGMAFPIQAQVAPLKEPPKPPVPSIEEVIARALQTHPEILVAEAKLAGAKAELELAKLSLSQRILKAKHRVWAGEQARRNAESNLLRVEEQIRAKAIGAKEIEVAREKVLEAYAQQAEAEAEWKMFIPTPKPVLFTADASWQPGVEIPPVTQADRERVDFLSRSVKIKKAEKLDLVEATKLLQALPELKGLTLRVPSWASSKELKTPPVLSWEDREMSVAGWLQFFSDEFNPQSHGSAGIVPDNKTGQYEWFVREYGLVFEHVEAKPVGAPTLAEFLKTVRSAPAPKK